MILIWEGRGLLVLLILFSAFSMGIGVPLLVGAPFATLHFSVPSSLLLSGALCWYLGRRWHKAEPNRVHSLYFIPVEYWLIVFGLMAVFSIWRSLKQFEML